MAAKAELVDETEGFAEIQSSIKHVAITDPVDWFVELNMRYFRMITGGKFILHTMEIFRLG